MTWKSCLQQLKKGNLQKDRQFLNFITYLRAYEDFEFFVQYFFQEYCQYPFSKMHLDFCRDEKDPARRNRREAIAAPRGNAKTTFKVLFKALHAIVYKYESFILIIGYSESEAALKVRDIYNELSENSRLKQVYGELAPARGGTHEFITRNNIKVLAKSRYQQVRGLKRGAHRPSLIILDDIEAPERVLNEEQRYKTKEWFEKDVLKLGAPGGGSNIIVIGTCLHPESLLSELLISPGWNGRKYQSILSYAENQNRWEQWKALYLDLSNPIREKVADDFFKANRKEMLAGTQVLWPEGEPYEYLIKMLINEGQASFNSEKQNEPHDPTRQLFDMKNASRFTSHWDEEGKFAGLIRGDDKPVPAHAITEIIAFHDPALGENVASDYAAIVVAAKDINGYYYCLDAWIEKAKPERQIRQAFVLQKKWKFDRLYLEDNHFQKLLKQNYKEMQEQYPEQRLRVIGVHQHHNKEDRISTLEPLIVNQHLLFAQDLNPRLINQMTLFPTSHDDGPDALHGAIEQLRKPKGSITMASPGYVIY